MGMGKETVEYAELACYSFTGRIAPGLIDLIVNCAILIR
jgi:hypothetical protein